MNLVQLTITQIGIIIIFHSTQHVSGRLQLFLDVYYIVWYLEDYKESRQVLYVIILYWILVVPITNENIRFDKLLQSQVLNY